MEKIELKIASILNVLYDEYHQSSKRSWLISGSVIFVVLFLLYYTAPFYSDDLIYMNSWNSQEPISSLSDILYYQYMHYMEWGGRSVAHTILQLLFLLGKPISAILNAFCHMGLAYAIMCCAIEKRSVFVYIEVLGMLYFLNPAFEETLVWYTGNANYMWTTFIILLTVYPFFKMINNTCEKYFWLYPLAFLAGWTNENMATTMMLFMISCVFLCYMKTRKINKRAIVMIILAGIGCMFLLLAPGNFSRASVLPSGFMGMMYRGHGQVNSWCNWLLPMWLLCILAYMWRKKQIDDHRIQIMQIIIWAIMSVLVMIASPSYPVRATFGSFVLLVIVSQKILDGIEQRDIIIRRILLDCIIFIGWIGSLSSIIILAYVRSTGVYIPG